MTVAMHALLSSCAPNIGDRTMAGIVAYESGWKPWSIGDNTTRRSYSFNTEREAEIQARYLLNIGHDIDTGLAQINSSNFALYRVTPETVFSPCTNIKVGASILSNNYARAVRSNWIGKNIITQDDLYHQEQYALVHALSAYNSGGFWASMQYAGNVYEIALSVKDSFTNIPISTPRIQKIAVIEPVFQEKNSEKRPIKRRLRKDPLIISHRTTEERSAMSILINGTTDSWSTNKI